VCGLLVLVLDAPLALGVDEAAAAAGAAGALLAAEVGLLGAAAALVLADAAADAEEDGRDEEAGECGPGEAVGVAAEAGILSGGAEGVAADDGPGGHERSSESLEEEGKSGVEAGEVCAETEAQSQDTGEEGDDREEDGDDVEREHEAAQVVELVGANELLRYVVLGAEVVRRVERKGSLSATAVCIASILCTAKREEGPSGGVAIVTASTRDAASGGLEEVNIANGDAVGCTGEDDEELQQDAAGKDDDGAKAEDGACEGHVCCVVLCVAQRARQLQ